MKAAGSIFFTVSLKQRGYRSPACFGLLRIQPGFSVFPKCQMCRSSKAHLHNAISHESKRRRMGVQKRAVANKNVTNLKARVVYWKRRYEDCVKVTPLRSKDLVDVVKHVEQELESDAIRSAEMEKCLRDVDIEALREALHAMRIEKEEEISKGESAAEKETNEDVTMTTSEKFRQLQGEREKCNANRSGNTLLRWPTMLLNVAITIYQHSHSAYSLLEGLGVLLLPSKRLMRAYCGAGLQSKGVDLALLKRQVRELFAYAQRTNHPLANTVYILKGFLNQDEMKLLANACVSKTSGEWRGFSEQFESINQLYHVYNPNVAPKKQVATHVTATLWSSFLLPFQILVCSRPTTVDSDATEVYCMMCEAQMAINAVGLHAPLFITDAAKANRAAFSTHMRHGFGATGMDMIYFFDPTHIFKR